nr:uncharacterized protein LOC109172115 [Ipomoea batatas]
MKTWSIFGPKAKRESGRFCRISEGVVDLEEEDILVMEETNLFLLLGRFAGRFPGMKAIDELIKSWGVRCKSEALANGHVMFYFYKKLFLHFPPNDVSLGFDDCRKLPILVEVDCSIFQPNQVTINLLGGNSFIQSVMFEVLPSLCTRCGSAMHITEKCPLSRVENKLKQRVIDIPNPQVVEASISAGSKSSPEVNGNGGSPDSNEGLESPPKENLVMQDNGKSPDVHVSHESPPKEHSVNLENNPKGKSVASDKGTLRKMGTSPHLDNMILLVDSGISSFTFNMFHKG